MALKDIPYLDPNPALVRYKTHRITPKQMEALYGSKSRRGREMTAEYALLGYRGRRVECVPLRARGKELAKSYFP